MNINRKSFLVPLALVIQQAHAGGFLEDSKASVSSRSLYFENDQRQGGADQRQSTTGLRADFSSGYTQGLIGFGIDAQALVGINLGGGITPHSTTTTNTVTPVQSDGTPVDAWSRAGANFKIKYSKTDVKAGNALAPNLPILVTNDSRVLPASYQGAILTSEEIDSLTFHAGYLNREIGRASGNWAGIAAGGRKGSNGFSFGGFDWKATKDLTLQYYYANLEDYYKQNFLGLVHVYQISQGQSLKTDLRYFNSSSDGKNGTDTNYAYRNGYNSGNLGEVDNSAWSAAFTYALGGHSLTLGHQRVSDDGGMAYINNANVVDGRGRAEGEGGSSIYLYTDIMINSFTKAGENSTFGIYKYDFAQVGVPGLTAAMTYVSGRDVKGTGGGVSTGRYSEWERDVRLDYVLQNGLFKGLGFSLRRANSRTELPTAQDQDQTRLYMTYSFAFK